MSASYLPATTDSIAQLALEAKKSPSLTKDTNYSLFLRVFEDQNEAVEEVKVVKVLLETKSHQYLIFVGNCGLLLLYFVDRGRKPPPPQIPELNLRARERSLEDQEDLV